jgi:DNA repair protein RAD5
MALKTIQVVLEGLLLRREKSMKDRDGNPIVPLPKKRFIMVCFADQTSFDSG